MSRFLSVALLFILSIACTSCDNYSSGSRAGTVNKFSRKGIVNKTWEGELLMGGLKQDADGNSTANIFEFSVDESHKRGENVQALADSLNKAVDLGLRVKLHYNQEQGTDWLSKRGCTGYYIDAVEIIRK